MKTMLLRIVGFALLSLGTVRSVHALAPLEPDDGKLLFGAWVDSRPHIGDTPKKFNDRLGRNASFFQFAQDVPLDFTKPLPYELLNGTGTDATLYITVYPPRNTDRPYDQITDQAIYDLGRQIAGFVLNGQKTFVRLFPEMNGNWNPWGQQPLAYKDAWRRVVTDFRRRMIGYEKDYALIWAPSVAQTAIGVTGYPFTSTVWRAGASNVTEFDELDTNKDGKFDSSDDPYSPYYPGDEWVDWVGASIYYYGVTWPWIHNEITPSGTFDSTLNGFGRYPNLYTAYSVAKNKPMMITETAAAFHVNVIDSAGNNVSAVDVGAGELAIKRDFWSQYITNGEYLDSHPKIKGICIFEFAKNEETTYRDFRISTSDAILKAFKSDMSTGGVDSRVLWSGSIPASGSNRIELEGFVLIGVVLAGIISVFC